jgi:hypothetical protein
MRPSPLLLLAAAALFGACAKAERPDAGKASSEPGRETGDDSARLNALRAARVWHEPSRPISSADLGANPEGMGAFRVDEVVPCTFRLHPSVGWTVKFDCTLAGGEDVKVKYGHNSVEVFGEVAATRLLSALGFGADRMYVVGSVKCRGCPLHPYPKIPMLDAMRQDPSREVTFEMAVIERKLPGRPIRGTESTGWAWYELDRVDPAAGGSSRAEVDALRLMGVFLEHWDNKAPNQRLVCLDEGASGPGCARPFAYLQDVGQTFGPRAVDLDGWRGARVWADASTCRVDMKDLPYHGATFGEAHIGEAGRRFLGDLLRQLTHAQIVALFEGARFPAYLRQSTRGRDSANWAAAFEDRVRQIVDRPPCPQ